MDRNREARRASSIVGSNGFNRRRHRTNSLRDSPDEDGGVELQESTRLRERVKKDRDRERDLRERDLRERERNLRERSIRSSKRRRLTNNRDDVGGADESSDDSLYDEDDDVGYEENTTTASAAAARVRVLPPPAESISNHQNSSHHHSSSSSLITQQQNNSTNSNHNLQHRKTFPPSSKVFKSPPVLKSGDEMIGVSVPRKARSASTKRLQDWISSSSNTNINNSGGFTGGDQVPASAPLPAAPLSPSSSNASMKKKLKLSSGTKNGLKLKPPKVTSSKPSSSNDLEIEIAEVLSGLMTQSQVPSSKKEDSREVNRSSSDGKSRVSSPISNSNSTNDPVSGPSSTPLTAVAPKRKRPRQVLDNSSYGGVRSSSVSAKPEMDQTPNSEIISPNVEITPGSVAENGYEAGGKTDISEEQPAPESVKLNLEFKPVVAEDLVAKEEVISSPKEKESHVVRTEEVNRVESSTMVTASFAAATLIKENSMVSEVEKVQNSREEKFEIDLMLPPPQVRSSPQRETKNDTSATNVIPKPVLPVLDSESMKPSLSRDREYGKGMASEEKKGEGTKEVGESNKRIENKKMEINLQLDLKKPDKENESQQKKQNQNQHQTTIKATKEEPFTGHSSSSLPLSMPMASWPGVIPSMGYMPPLQGVVPVDKSTVTPAPIQPPFAQPRPKRCATHCYIARNIHNLQQLMKMNPFWPAPAGSASLYGPKPAADLYTGQNNFAFRGVVNNAAPDNKGPTLVSVLEKGSQTVTSSDSAQRKQQILIQQAMPPGPALIFPMNHQHTAVASAPSAVKSPTVPGGVPSSNSSSASASASAGGAQPAAMSFHYPNMASNEQTQYLAILQNNAYPFPIQAVGAPPNYRGAPAQGAMPMFNGSFYSSQIIHPSQLQQQPMQQPHQNASVSGGGSSSSQKHLQRSSQSSGVNGGTGSATLQNFPTTQKSQSSQQLYQSQNQHVHPSKPTDSEDSPSTTDSRVSRASMNIYGQNFAMPIHPQNFALASGNQSEKKPQKQQHQHQGGIKNGVDSLPPHSFAMSFGPINGSTPQGIDITSMSQNHAIFQSFPEAARQNMQMMAAAAAAQNKNFKISEDGKSGGGDSSAATANDDERKILAGKSFAFTDGVNESSGRSLNVATGPSRSSRPVTNTGVVGGAMTVVPNAHIQAQLQQQQIQMLHQHKQQQQQLAGNAVNRNKAPVVTSNGSIYSDHFHPSSTIAAKYQNTLSGYPQNPTQSQSQSQSPQWKSSTKTPTPQASSSLASSTTRTQQQQMHHTQISFGGNQKPSTNSHGQTTPPIVGSPTNSSISKGGANGSPRTSTSTPTNHKLGGQASLQTHQLKKSQSILGNPQIASSSMNGAKPQTPHQQQLPKNMQPAQIFFSNQYTQAQSPHGYYMQQQQQQQQQLRRPEVHQQPPGAPTPSSSTSNGRTNDPAKAIAAATCNAKGGDLPS
ncbi:hypothetical protein RD792_017347 [Penstemon davidsonii]|uniref:Protein TIME FOR COFFEE n=1 Tax=Penstemon davidsonii TaxID=160366 RepID=A0ABR0CMJ2_9LAMI|nr:hypothetical protein RD792_017347 [Penstemon davidsonii]